MNLMRQERETEKFIEDLNKSRLMYHVLLVSAIFCICLATIIGIYAKGSDGEIIYKICFYSIYAIGGIMAFLAVKAEIKYNKKKKSCPNCRKHIRN